MKKIKLIGLLLGMVLACTACGKDTNTDVTSQNTANSESTEQN